MFHTVMNAFVIPTSLAIGAQAWGQTELAPPCTPDTIGTVLGEEAIASRRLTQQLALFTNALRAGKARDPVQRVIWIAPTDCPMLGFDVVAVPTKSTEVTGTDGVKSKVPTHVVYVSENHLRWAGVANLMYSGREQACRIMMGKADDLSRVTDDPRDPSIASCVFRVAQIAHEGSEQAYWNARKWPNSQEEWEGYSMRLGGVIGRFINEMKLEFLPSSTTPDALQQPGTMPDKQ